VVGLMMQQLATTVGSPGHADARPISGRRIRQRATFEGLRMPEGRMRGAPVRRTPRAQEAHEARACARSLERYARASRPAALAQLSRGLASFTASWLAMGWALANAPILVPVLTLPIAVSMILLFVVQHDCGHRSFFASRAANDWVGRFLCVLTVLPYTSWRRAHQVHHATSGDLDRRGIGDIPTLTVEEYRGLSPLRRLEYRLRRNPFVMFGLGGLYLFVTNRLPHGAPGRRLERWLSTQGTNAGIAAFWLLGAWLLGIGAWFVVLHLAIVMVYFAGGIWLFYVGHQFPAMRWQRRPDWDLQAASLYGSSFVELPAPLRWFGGGICIHHVHHLRVRIPNYRLAESLAAHPMLAVTNRLSFREALGTHRLALWDEHAGRLVSFGEVARRGECETARGGKPCRV
jgi:omega-6 fatty acid desaturase (delta-12 desaturase)